MHDCLSYLSRCVQNGRLEHYFCLCNNLLKHKLTRPDDRKFVLDKIKSIKNNLIKEVPEILTEDKMLYLEYIGNDVDQMLHFLENASLINYRHLANAIGKFHEYYIGVFEVLYAVTAVLSIEDLSWASKVFKDSPPTDVDPTYIENTLRSIDIRLANNFYSASLDNSLSEEKSKRRFTYSDGNRC